MMHFGKSHQQQVHGIQHQLNAHEDDNGIPAREYTHDAYAKKGDRQ